MKKSIDAINQSVTFTFDDGLAPVTLRMTEVHPDNATYAMLHGFAQRLGDNAAITKKDAPNGVTEAMRRDAVMQLRDHYASGTAEWNLKVSERKPAQNPVIAAIAAKLGVTYAEAEAEVARRMLAELA